MYSASISLAYLCWLSQDSNPESILRQAINAALSIHLRLLRFDALCVISLHPRVEPDFVILNKGRSLRNELEQQLIDISTDLNPLLHTNILRRCYPVLGITSGIHASINILLTKLNAMETRMTNSDRQAIYATLLDISYGNQVIYSYLNNTLQKMNEQQNGELKLRLPLQSNYLQTYFTQNSLSSLSSSMITLLSSMYLTELTSDCHRIFSWLSLNLSNDPEKLLVHERQSMCSLLDNGVLTATLAIAVETSFRNDLLKNSEMDTRMDLSRSLHSIVTVESTA